MKKVNGKQIFFLKKITVSTFRMIKKTSTQLLNKQIEGVIFILVLPLNGRNYYNYKIFILF